MNSKSWPGKAIHIFVVWVFIFSMFPANGTVSYAAAPAGDEAPTETPTTEINPDSAAADPATSTVEPSLTPETPAGETPAGETPTATTEVILEASPTLTETSAPLAETASPTSEPSLTPTETPTVAPEDAALARAEQLGKLHSEQGLEGLLSKINSNGKVRLIVGLNRAFTPLGGLSANAAAGEMAGIAAGQQELLEELAGLNVSGVKQFETIPYMALQTDEAGLNALLASSRVNYVHEDKLSRTNLDLSVPRIGGPSAWARGVDGSGITVAILDTGVDKTHPFLSGAVVSEACYSSNDSFYRSTSVCPGGATATTATGSAMPYGGTCPAGECDHGTHVAGIAAGGTGTGMSGVAPGAGVIAIQVFSRFDNTTECDSSPCAMSWTSDQILGLERVYALRFLYNIAAVNMSLGGGQFTSQAACDAYNSDIKPAIDNLRSAGIATVISSGNNGFTNAMGAPGCISSAISVGATTDSDTVSYYSNSASFLNLLAPGSSINSSVPGGGYESWNGTSMAAPHVTGAWAILKQGKPAATVSEILTAFTSTGTNITDSKAPTITKPRINVNSALSILTVGIPVQVAPSGTITNANTFTYSWSAVSEATRYQLIVRNATTQVDLVNTAYTKADVNCGSGTGTCSIAVPSILPNASYIWYVRAGDSNVWGSWATKNFVVSVPIPGTPTTSTPTGTYTTQNAFTYTWTAVSATTKYQLLIRNSSGTDIYNAEHTPTEVNCPAGTGACSLALSTPLDNGTFSWWVRASNAFGWGTWSALKTLVVSPIVTTITPSGTITANNTPTYTWNAVNTADQYQLKVSNTAGTVLTDITYTASGAGCPAGTGTCSVTPVTGLPDGSYTWTVRMATASTWGTWSTARSLVMAFAIPPALTLVTPSGTITNANTFTYTWNAVSNADKYELYIKNAAGTILHDIAHTPTEAGCASGTGTCAIALADVLPNTTYTWWVRAGKTTSWGSWGTSKSFVVSVPVPGTPTAGTPSGTYTTQNAFTYSWTAVSLSTRYQLWIRNSSGVDVYNAEHTPTEVNCAAGSGSCWLAISAPLNNGTYTWYVRAGNVFGFGAWSAVKTMVVSPIVTTITPSGTITANNTPTYTWNAVNTADQYNLKVTNTAGTILTNINYTPTEAGCAAGTGTCSVTPVTGLPDGSYTWTVRMATSSAWGTWSTARSLVIAFAIPPALTLLTPSGTITNANTFTYTWDAVSNADKYELYIKNAAGTILHDVTYTPTDSGCAGGTGTCAITYADVLPNTTYTWWVRAGKTTSWGSWGTSKSFVVSVPVPGTPTAGTPSGTYTTQNVFTYSWTAVSLSTRYQLWIRNSSGVDVYNAEHTPTEVNCAAGTGSCSLAISAPLNNGTYTWYVRAGNAFGFGAWSAVKTMVVSPIVTTITPSGTITANNTPTYTWNAVNTADQYNLKVTNTAGTILTNITYTPTEAGCAAGTGTCTVTPVTGLPDGSYTWTVRMATSSAWGTWSTARSLVMAFAIPPALTQISPSGTITDANTFTYTWNAVYNAEQYQLTLRNSAGTYLHNTNYTPTEAGCADGSGACSVTLAGVLANGTYTWTVKAAKGAAWGPLSTKSFAVSIPIPAAPVASIPSGTYTTQNAFTYTWNAVSIATRYQLWVRNAAGTDVYNAEHTPTEVNCPASSGACTLALSTPLNNGTYTWYVRAGNVFGFGAWSTVKSFMVSPAPAVVSPSGIATANNTPTYTWNAVNTADQYQLKVSNTAGTIFTDITYSPTEAGCAAGTGECSVTPVTGLPDGSYTWTVRMATSSVWGTWSTVKSLVMAFAIPPALTLVTPSGTITNANTFTYTWNAVSNADKYELYIKNAAGTILHDVTYTPTDSGCAGGTGTCAISYADVLPNGTYTWWVRAGKTTSWGSWGTSKSFVVSVPVPGTPTAATPSGTYTAQNAFTYSWTAVSLSTRYQLWIRNSSGVDVYNAEHTPTEVNCAAGSGSCWLAISTPLNNGTYTWYVRAGNVFGFGAWSAVKTMVVSPIVTTITPSGTITANNTPTYTWNAVNTADQYNLKVTNAAGTILTNINYTPTEAGCAAGTGTCSVTPVTGLADGSYTWTVRMATSSVWGTWSTAKSLVIAFAIPPALTLVTPSGTITNANTFTYTWNAVSNADKYELYIKNAAGTILHDIAHTPTEAGCASGTGTCAIALADVLPNGTYTWWVRAGKTTSWGSWGTSKSFVVSVPVPGTPTAGTPSGTYTTQNAFTYSWTAVSLSTRYQLWVRNSSGVDVYNAEHTPTEVNCAAGSGSCWLAISAPLNNGTYTWYVRAGNAFGFGAWSAVKTMVVSPIVTTITPSGTITANNTPTYTWNAVNTADQYNLKVTNAAGTILTNINYTPTEAGCAAGTGECSVTPVTGLADGSYTWTVRMATSSAWGTWSTARSLVMAFAIPPALTLVTPTSTITDANTFTYTWNAVSNADKYELYIRNAAGTILHDVAHTPTEAGCAGGTGTCAIALADVLPNTTYTWWVRAGKSTSWGPWSSSKIFTVSVAYPGIPTLGTPSGTITSNAPTFSWNPVSGATSYQFLLKNAGGVEVTNLVYTPTDAGCGSGTCAVTPGTYTFGTTYNWTVRGGIVLGYGSWATAKTFTPTLNKPVTISPTGTIADTQPAITWNAVSNATGYHVWVQSPSTVYVNTLYTKAAVGCSGGTGVCTLAAGTVPVLPRGTTYTWGVQAENSGGYSGYNTMKTFTVIDLAGDADGDSLPNGWEINGYDANSDGTIDVNLPALGARWDHKDIFVEMDYMVRPTATLGLAPNATVRSNIVAVFANAPLSNPDGTTGINIHLELDDQVPLDTILNPVWTEVDAIKAGYFDTNRAKTHHYMIWADGYGADSSSGISRGINATDFIVTLGLWNGGSGGTDAEKTGTFIHELGHNLNLLHGGVDSNNYKPNYLSVMSYTYQTWGLYRNGCWGDEGCPLNFDYQRIDTPVLNESALNEVAGLGSVASSYGAVWIANSSTWFDTTAGSNVDWNKSGTYTAGVVQDINNDGIYTNNLTAQNNWPAISFSGGGTIGSGLSAPTLLRRMSDTFTMDELTWEEQQELVKKVVR